jgi:uncharacterized protein YoxC
MNTDERLDRLAERVDAIAQSVERLTSLHRDLEEKAARDRAETSARFADTLQFINRLAHVAEAHEQRLDRIEGQ